MAASVAYSLQAVTAAEGEFTAASGTVNFAAGQTTAGRDRLHIARGQLDLNHLAREERASRGLDRDGVWVGFARAREIHGFDR